MATVGVDEKDPQLAANSQGVPTEQLAATGTQASLAPKRTTSASSTSTHNDDEKAHHTKDIEQGELKFKERSW